MSVDQPVERATYKRFAILFASVFVLALTLTWVYLSMRAVMDIGGACAEGGPYVAVQPCPDTASVLLSAGIPVMLVASFVGTAVAASLSAPNLLVPMWAALFGSLGWNFLEYGAFTDGIVWGWLICGIVFELMALPAVLVALPFGTSRWVPETAHDTVLGARGWWASYVFLGGVGVVAGVMSYAAWT